VRTDKTLSTDEGFRKAANARFEDEKAFEGGASQSGHERNHLFVSRAGKEFMDVSGVSGLDHPGDARSFVLLDYDRDGWQDLAVANANAPLLLLYRNELEEMRGDGAEKGRFIALRFVGGNRESAPSGEFSARDGYGAKVSVSLGDRTLVRELRCGEGLAAQNSSTMMIGIGPREEAASITVKWPSGIQQETHRIPAGSLVTVHEDPSQAPGGEPFEVQPYPGLRSQPRPRPPADKERIDAPLLAMREAEIRNAKVNLFTTMATWCEVCKGELPRVAGLRAAFGPEELGLFALPIDPNDSQEKLAAYKAEFTPAYDLLAELPLPERAQVSERVMRTFKIDVLPTTFVVDGSGFILDTVSGVPSISEIRGLLRE